MDLKIDYAFKQLFGNEKNKVITSSEFFSENMEAVRDGHITERKFVDPCLQYIEKKFSGRNSAEIINC